MPELQTSPGTPQTQVELAPDGRKLLDELTAKVTDTISKAIDVEKDDVKKMVDDLVALRLKGQLIKGNLFKRIDAAIAWIDARLSSQVNAIIHHPEFRAMEGAWRGLQYLTDHKPAGEHLQIHFLNISKKELGDTLERFSAESGQTGWRQSPIFKHIFTNRFNMPGGNPFACLVGDYQFDKSAGDISLLKRMGAICSAAHAPFVSAASPKLLGLNSWQELPNPAELEAKMATPDYASWNSLRESEDGRYLALTLPRFMARLPYGEGKANVDGFNFNEDLRPTKGTDWAERESKHDNYVWANAAYAMAANIANTFHDTCFTVSIRGVESGGKVEGLPVDSFKTDDGGIDIKCPTEQAIDMSKEAELGNLGFLPLVHWKNTDFAAFVGAQTVKKPEKYETAVATQNAELSARLPYVFLVSRFAHYLKKMIFEWVGTNKTREQLEKDLNEWIMLHATAATSASEEKLLKPLEDARVTVIEDENRPGYFEAFMYLKPHIQLEGVSVNLGVVAKLPK